MEKSGFHQNLKLADITLAYKKNGQNQETTINSRYHIHLTKFLKILKSRHIQIY